MTQLSNPFMHFNVIKDYRQSGKINHELSDIILLTICGVLSGHDTREGISDFGDTRLDFLSTYGYFADGIPSADTIAPVMGMISTKALQKSFIDWMRDCHDLTEGQVIAVDGKTVRGSYNKYRGQSAIHMINVFATANGVCLAQSKVNEKTNEIKEIPKLLEMLYIAGCLITIYAMGCQKKIAQKIFDKSADYLLAIKGNQGKLHRAFKDYYDPKMLQLFDGDSHLSHDKSHGRLETRCALINKDLSVLGNLDKMLAESKLMIGQRLFRGTGRFV